MSSMFVVSVVFQTVIIGMSTVHQKQRRKPLRPQQAKTETKPWVHNQDVLYEKCSNDICSSVCPFPLSVSAAVCVALPIPAAWSTHSRRL